MVSRMKSYAEKILKNKNNNFLKSYELLLLLYNDIIWNSNS